MHTQQCSVVNPRMSVLLYAWHGTALEDGAIHRKPMRDAQQPCHPTEARSWIQLALHFLASGRCHIARPRPGYMPLRAARCGPIAPAFYPGGNGAATRGCPCVVSCWWREGRGRRTLGGSIQMKRSLEVNLRQCTRGREYRTWTDN